MHQEAPCKALCQMATQEMQMLLFLCQQLLYSAHRRTAETIPGHTLTFTLGNTKENPSDASEFGSQLIARS